MNGHSANVRCQPQFVSFYGSRRGGGAGTAGIAPIHSRKSEVSRAVEGELPGSTIADLRLAGPLAGSPRRPARGHPACAGESAPRRVWNRAEGRTMLDVLQQQSLVTRLNRIEGQVRGI